MSHNPVRRSPRQIPADRLAHVQRTLEQREAWFDKLADRLATLGHVDQAKQSSRIARDVRELRKRMGALGGVVMDLPEEPEDTSPY